MYSESVRCSHQNLFQPRDSEMTKAVIQMMLWGGAGGRGEGVPPPPFDRNIRLKLTSKVADFLVGTPPPPPSPQGVPEELILVSQRSRSWNRF